MSFRKLNELVGWLVFAIALVTYALTMAPTASFWDCGEFIACANELEVTHPPGAPFYLLLGRIFAMLALGDTSSIALMVNLLSVLAGAFTSLFTCWIASRLAWKSAQAYNWPEASRTVASLLAGATGGLACTFADSIWFNAVEAEVYALSGFFTALVFWLMLKWEARADEPGHWRWLVLIAYMMGLSIGVHLLNLLTIPALALVFFFRKYPFSWKGLLLTLGIAMAILAFIQYGIIQYAFSLAWGLERLLTGTQSASGEVTGGLGLPMGTGSALLLIFLLGGLLSLLFFSAKRKHVRLHIAALSLLMILIGFSSYSLIFIRSQANPPIDMNDPDNLLTFLSYMKREQYGDRPLLRGPLYSARPATEVRGQYRVTRYESQGKKYLLLPGAARYVEDIDIQKPVYENRDMVWFPRMWESSRYDRRPFGYLNFVKRTGEKEVTGRDKTPYDDRPTRGEDLQFFLGYQLTHMYFRYFMWNFAGRASDRQDDYWESGLEPRAIRERNADNPAKNHYYFLPLLLGLLGIVWQLYSDKKMGFVLLVLFFFTGIAIVMYLNQYPGQPRERDYSYAGSFQAFCIWIGLGVMFLTEVLRKYLKKASPWLAGGLALLVPLLMASQNWDDHSRRGRWVDRDFAYNLLNSCDPDAILFTAGDNDTFPLWYLQEVEGIRTDVRVVNLELLISDWYVEQLLRPQNEAAPIPLSMPEAAYTGDRDQVIAGRFSRLISLPVDKEQLMREGIIQPEEAARVDSVLDWNFKARSPNFIYRKDSVMIDMIRQVAEDGWRRPLYFATGMRSSNFLGLNDYLHLEGLNYRLLPIRKRELDRNASLIGGVREARCFAKLTDSLLFRGLNEPGVYLDEHIRLMVLNTYRSAFSRLANHYGELSTQVMADSLADQLAFYQQRIQQLITYQQQHISESLYPLSLTQLSQRVASMLRAQVRSEDFDQSLAALQAQVETRLGQFESRQQALPQSDPAFAGAMVLLQHWIANQETQRASRLARRLEALSGVKIIQ